MLFPEYNGAQWPSTPATSGAESSNSLDESSQSTGLLLGQGNLKGNLLEHIEEYTLSTSAESSHSVADEEIEKSDDVVEAATVVDRRQEIEPLECIAQTIETGDLQN